jgi:hypothetical protein
MSDNSDVPDAARLLRGIVLRSEARRSRSRLTLWRWRDGAEVIKALDVLGVPYTSKTRVRKSAGGVLTGVEIRIKAEDLPILYRWWPRESPRIRQGAKDQRDIA